ncbi:hypothetical protein BC835DRAFT_606444 [Cytidiella melzeri]|nr:hypothetical protein BC835DRAFT_606444 [Cytidiella melzeri]
MTVGSLAVGSVIKHAVGALSRCDGNCLPLSFRIPSTALEVPPSSPKRTAKPVTDPRSDDSNSMRSGPPGDVASMKAFTDSGSDSAPPIASTGQSKREIPAVLARTTAVENVETNESSIDSAAGSVSHPLDTRDIPLSSSDVDNILHALPPRCR